MQFMIKYVRKYGVLFVISVLLVTLEAVGDLLQPTIMARIIDEGVAAKDMDTVLRLGGVMLIVTACGAAAASIRNFTSSIVSQRFGADLRQELFEKIQRLAFANIDKFDKASLVTRLTNDVTQIQNFLNGMMRIFVKAPLLGVGGLVMAFRLNPYLATVLLVVIPIVGMLIIFNMRIGFPLFLRVQMALDRLNSVMREYLSGVRVVKAFNRFGYETDKFNDINKQYEKTSIRSQRMMAIFSPGVALAMNAGIVAVIALGGLRVEGGHMQVGHIVAFVNYMLQILFSLTTVTLITNMFVRAKASSGRIAEVLAEQNPMGYSKMAGESSAPCFSGAATVQGEVLAAAGAVEFDRVSFSYEGAAGETALRSVSFRCEPGETVAIIGSTGSGKSTLAKLVSRFYDPTSGTVRVNGQDIRQIDPALLRERIALVPQQAILFAGTVLENIRIGKQDASLDEVTAAAEQAAAHAFIAELPERYESIIGQGGVNFSGGQKQRVSIARALVRKPEILLLDDCTSALDSDTEAAVKRSIRELGGSVTCLLIAQRISSVKDADKIVVLDDGEVAGIGTHAQLLAECEVYREIYRSQIGEEANHHVQ
ncbi:ABC transporter ATP-binding protein [Paenibacillus sp. NPDC058071]|uniref:ABC transporter ATP-binding protein n=1 Tax=Paenibacillus sp. NPDC058071 TaxID=3346326 RepID=UPI0036DD3A79